ncbi:MAG: hypothetical protein V7K50_04020 [Nostoc sp.]|uniref:hypothetical protein n=1 Tax=Nostoc sp. TaxID=1180 RepID=UPI002FF931EA
MINGNFRKVAALTLASLVTFSSSAFATTPSPTPTVKPTPKPNTLAFTRAIAKAQIALRAAAAANSNAVGGPGKIVVAKAIAEAQSLIVNAINDENLAGIPIFFLTARPLAEVLTLLRNALTVATSDAISGPGKTSLARSIAIAETVAGDAAAIAAAAR